jgi:hypothetical protein
MSRKQAFRVGRSRTGLGLFAAAPIRKGAFIVEYKGRKSPPRRPTSWARGNPLYEINSRWTIDGTTRRNPLLRQSFVPAECRVPQDRPQGHPARHQDHQTRRRNHLQLRRDYFINVITPRGCRAKVPEETIEARAKAPGKKRRRRISD